MVSGVITSAGALMPSGLIAGTSPLVPADAAARPESAPIRGVHATVPSVEPTSPASPETSCQTKLRSGQREEKDWKYEGRQLFTMSFGLLYAKSASGNVTSSSSIT